MGTNILTAALNYTGLGLSVIPVFSGNHSEAGTSGETTSKSQPYSYHTLCLDGTHKLI
jgi:hypothetical protein